LAFLYGSSPVKEVYFIFLGVVFVIYPTLGNGHLPQGVEKWILPFACHQSYTMCAYLDSDSGRNALDEAY